MVIKPLFDRVLLRAIEPAEQVRGGIIVPAGTLTGGVRECEVIALGYGVSCPYQIHQDERKFLPLAAGDRVILAPGTGTPIEVEGQKYLIIQDEEILAVLCPDGPSPDALSPDGR